LGFSYLLDHYFVSLNFLSLEFICDLRFVFLEFPFNYSANG
jgi:hypothetical protein